jgi:hypothetical protein
MCFNDWLMWQTDRSDDVGTLARFATHGVDDWPRGCRVRRSALRRYLVSRVGFCPEVYGLLDDALVLARSDWLDHRAAARVMAAAA